MENDAGFTLIELLVVIAIIGILSTIGMTQLSNAREKARDTIRRVDISNFRPVLALYFDDHSGFPADYHDIVPQYVERAPNDPVTALPYGYLTCLASGAPGTDHFLLYASLEATQVGSYFYLTDSGAIGTNDVLPACGS